MPTKPVATPARAPLAPATTVPRVKAAAPSAPPGLVAAKGSPGSNPVSAKSTPIKSPDLKRSKTESVSFPKVPSGVSKDLNSAFERAAESEEIPATQPVSRL